MKIVHDEQNVGMHGSKRGTFDEYNA